MPKPRFNIPAATPPVSAGVLADVLRLEVETAPSGLVNLVANTDGELGGWGWLSPVAATAVRNFYSNNYGHALRFERTSGAAHFTTEPLPVVAGQYVAASWRHRGYLGTAGSSGYRVRFTFLNAAGAVVSSSTQSGTYDANLNPFTTINYGATLVPATATHVLLRYDCYTNLGVTPPPGSGSLYFDRVTVATAATSGALLGLGYLPPVPYLDVLGPTHEIKVERAALDVGSLTATILDSTLDPADAPTIRPGRRVRLRALTTDGLWETLYTGKLTAATVRYHLLEDVPDQKRARITLTAVDNTAVLAAAERPQSVATVDELPYVLEGVSVPWNANGSGDQVTSATVRVTAEGVTALDQVALTRDTAHGYAWVDRFGVINVWDAATIPATSLLTLDEDLYTDAPIGFDTDECINEVVVTVRSKDSTGQAVETTTAYTDADSIRTWGRHRAEFTVLAPTSAATFAAEVLAANAVPVLRIPEAFVSVRSATELPAAHLDLYDAVTLVNTDKGLSELARVTSISLDITPEAFFATFGFATPDAVAAPQVIAPLKSTATIRSARGRTLVTPSGSPPIGSVNVTFPAPMAQVPTVTATPYSTANEAMDPRVTNTTVNGFTLTLRRASATATNVEWIALCDL